MADDTAEMIQFRAPHSSTDGLFVELTTTHYPKAERSLLAIKTGKPIPRSHTERTWWYVRDITIWPESDVVMVICERVRRDRRTGGMIWTDTTKVFTKWSIERSRLISKDEVGR